MKRYLVVLLLALAAAFATPLAMASEEKWTGPDKVLHFVVIGGVPAAIVTLQTGNPWLGFAAGVGAGALKEGLDALSKNGKASGKDFVVTALGAAVGAYAGKWALTFRNDTYTVSYRTSF